MPNDMGNNKEDDIVPAYGLVVVVVAGKSVHQVTLLDRKWYVLGIDQGELWEP